MTTVERPGETDTKAETVSEVYTVVKDGREYHCQQVFYLGEVHELCWDDRPASEFFDEVFAGKGVRESEPGYEEMKQYMDQFLIDRTVAGGE